VYVGGQNWTGDTLQHVFRYNYDGTYAGNQATPDPSVDARFTADLEKNIADIAIDSAGLLYASYGGYDEVDKFDASGVPSAWVTAEATNASGKFLDLDDADRLYLATGAGKTVERWDAAGDPDGNPDVAATSPNFAKAGSTYVLDGDTHRTALWATMNAVHVGPDGLIYGASGFVHQYNPPHSNWWQNGVYRWDPATGEVTDSGEFFANEGADAAPLVSPNGGMIFIVPEPTTMGLLLVGGIGLLIRSGSRKDGGEE
jgi:hypothetical protein